MQHPVFGKLTYSASAAGWVTHQLLPEFARFGARSAPEKPPPAAPAGPQPPSPQTQAMEQFLRTQLEGRLRATFGPVAEQMIAAIDEQAAKAQAGTPDEEQRAELEKQAAKARRKAERLRQGLFPLHIGDPEQSGPSPEQEAAFLHLKEHEAEVCQAVMGALFQSYQEYAGQLGDLPEISSPEGLGTAAHLLEIMIVPQHRDGVSHLVVETDCDWEVEHGMYVVYHPATGATATDYDGVDELLSADGMEGDAEPEESSGNYEIVEALLAGNEKRVQQLLAAGHDINALGNPPYPPLCMAVTQLNGDLVKRLLALGADPSLRDFENKTALQRAKWMLKTITPKKDDKLRQVLLALAQQANAPGLGDPAVRLREIIALLEAAGAG